VEVRALTTIESSSSAVSKVWDRDASSAASGGFYDTARTKGSTLSFAFTGTSVKVLGERRSNGGYADVYIDGKKMTSSPVSFYASSAKYQVAVFTKTGLSSGKHTAKVSVLGTKPSASSGSWVDVDAFAVGALRTEEDAATVTGGFPTVSASSASGGSYLTLYHTQPDIGSPPKYSMAFRGTGVDVFFTGGTTSGKVDVFVDGVKVGSAIDLYRSSTTYKLHAFTTSGLGDTSHVLDIVPTGTHSSPSKGNYVDLDYISVG
jgi:hypothetical protein